MKILAVEVDAPGADPNGFTPEILKAEARRAWELQQSGVVREIYFRANRTAAVIMLECDGVAEAEAVLATLPLVQAGLIAFELIPLVAYPNFARLFADGERK